jgi:membrane protein DedA with SNARE-associated domain
VNQLELWAQGLAGTGWVYLAMYLFATIDGFFPPIPSESLVIALATLSWSTGRPALLLVLLVAAAGAFTGDQIAYQIGRMVHVRQLRLFRGPRGQGALDWAEHALQHRGASFIIAARYIPVGRVAVNMTAGALHYRRQRFMAVDAVASLMWAAYSAVIGIAAGAVLGHNPLLAIAAGVVSGVVLGVVVDWLLRRLTGSRQTRDGSRGRQPGTGLGAGADPAPIAGRAPVAGPPGSGARSGDPVA